MTDQFMRGGVTGVGSRSKSLWEDQCSSSAACYLTEVLISGVLSLKSYLLRSVADAQSALYTLLVEVFFRVHWFEA